LSQEGASGAGPSGGIIGGKEITTRAAKAAKSVVMLELLGHDGRSKGVCTATVIHAHAIVTAAHCFDPRILGDLQSFNVIFDSVYHDKGTREARHVLKYKVHPNYNDERDPK